MSLTTPEAKLTLSQVTYALAAKGIRIDLEKLSGIVLDLRCVGLGAERPSSIDLELQLDVSTPERVRASAAKVRELAAQLDASVRDR